MSFALILPPRIVFGTGSIDGAGEEASCLGARRVLIITSPGMPGRAHFGRVLRSLEECELRFEVFSEVSPEPPLEEVERCAGIARDRSTDLVLGLGGGSVMDVAKKAAAELGLPKLMVPTTAGTGSEVTHESVLKVDGRKKAFVSPELTPDAAIVDPDLGETMSRRLVASSGMDALAHAVECYESRGSNPVCRTLAGGARELITGNLKHAVDGDSGARSNMFLASLMAGMAFGNSGTALGHALSYPLSNRGVPHGEAVAMVLPYALEFNGADSSLVQEVRDLLTLIAPTWDRAWDLAEMAGEVMADERHLANNPTKVRPGDVTEIFRKMKNDFA